MKKRLCEPFIPQVEAGDDKLITSTLHLYKQLKELGFTYYKGKVTIIDMEVKHE